MLKPALEFYATIHDKLVADNNTNVSEYAKLIESDIVELLKAINIKEHIFYGISDFEPSIDTFLMPDYLNALQLVKFKLKSLGYNAAVTFTSNITIKF